MSPRIIFEQELAQLKDKVAEMGRCAQISYDRLFGAVKESDRETMKLLLDTDHKMADMQRGIEAGCLALMTKQQPVAKDLRFVSAALKVVTDMERIGDHIVDMAELFLRREKPFLEEDSGETFLCMMEEARSMLRGATEAFADGDAEAARMVIDGDNVVDEYFNRIRDEMMEAIRNQSLNADRVVDNLMIAKYLEKVGDHAVNIGEWAVFQVTGDIEGVTLY